MKVLKIYQQSRKKYRLYPSWVLKKMPSTANSARFVVKSGPNLETSTLRIKKLIYSEDGHDTSAYKNFGHFFHVFCAKCLEAFRKRRPNGRSTGQSIHPPGNGWSDGREKLPFFIHVSISSIVKSSFFAATWRKARNFNFQNLADYDSE